MRRMVDTSGMVAAIFSICLVISSVRSVEAEAGNAMSDITAPKSSFGTKAVGVVRIRKNNPSANTPIIAQAIHLRPDRYDTVLPYRSVDFLKTPLNQS